MFARPQKEFDKVATKFAGLTESDSSLVLIPIAQNQRPPAMRNRLIVQLRQRSLENKPDVMETEYLPDRCVFLKVIAEGWSFRDHYDQLNLISNCYQLLNWRH